ncbi:MAG: ABC transporter permease subunit [Thermoplasmata archaeon]|nr:ABC transporter permease subunit [Thermoplasmata archaeon]MCI4360018.1 ABC transporter permease subunit [Thermoplasmata archaeon]
MAVAWPWRYMAVGAGTMRTPGPDPADRTRPSTREAEVGGRRPSAFTRTPRQVAFVASAFAAAVSIPAAVGLSGTGLGRVAADLRIAVPDLGASFTRMLLAYLLSLGFAIVYGYFAATKPTGERVLIPVLDILQSVPILGFFPIAIAVFVSLTPGSPIGANVASIFLIFTSMSWNMVFGVYESLKSVPNDLKEAADTFGVQGRQKLRRLLLPATANRLVYNSVLSWTAGWYYLVAAELISTASSTTRLQGIGTFLLTAAGSGDGTALLVGLAVLIALIAAMDLWVWRPLGRWAEKYRYDVSPSGEGILTGGPKNRAPLVRAVRYVRRGFLTSVNRIGLPIVALAIRASHVGGARRRPFWNAAGRSIALGTLLVLVWLLLISIGTSVYRVLSGPIVGMVRAQIDSLPLALGLSGARLVAAYAISLAIGLPLAVLFARRPIAARYGLPVVEIVASVPATALFPAFIFVLWPVIGAGATSILMLITGMIWYLFFNLLSGVRSLPPDLDEAARSYGLTGAGYRRRLLFPAIFPAFVTGSITALGGGWNALVIAEYLQNPAGHAPFQVLGIGELIDVGNAELNGAGLPLMVVALFTMVLTVVVVNEVLWKPLYRRAVEKYRYD